ncbi:MAG: tetratricopeptide repeat protein [Sphingomonas bacterium]|nr:tetratricopeptide repeat protein [Sphingomonas bacterium]
MGSLGALILVAVAAPASAMTRDALGAYVNARAADASGDPATASRLLASLVRSMPAETALRRRAIGHAIEAGDMELALQLAGRVPAHQASLDLRLLQVADELRRGNEQRASMLLRTPGGIIDSSFLAPFVEAWTRAAKRDSGALEMLGLVPDTSPLAGQRDEQRALILLKLKRPAEALPFAEFALAKAGGRAERLRLAFADGFRAAGDKVNALTILAGTGATLADARARLAAGKPIGQAVDTPAKAYAELLLGLSLALNKMQDKSLPISLAQIAHYANPDNPAGTLLLALLLDAGNRDADALATLRTIAPGEPFAAQAQDAEVRILTAMKQRDEALARARAFVSATPNADAYSRLGSALVEREQFTEAADAYGRALALSASRVGSDDGWALHLFRASALESANRWDEAKQEMATAMRLSPDNPLLLNFLGYGQLERGENLDQAEAMVRKASALRPDDSSITDSLGWAQYKRGRTDEAIATLQRAAEGDPAQAEIHEHLGDALYTAGRRIEARFAWRAALVTAEGKAKTRLDAKLAAGLTPANASP